MAARPLTIIGRNNAREFAHPNFQQIAQNIDAAWLTQMHWAGQFPDNAATSGKNIVLVVPMDFRVAHHLSLVASCS